MVDGCPYPIAEHALRLAAIELCQRSLCWGAVQTTTGTTSPITLIPPAESVITDVLRVTWDDLALSAITQSQADDTLAEQATGTPEGYYRPSRTSLALIPAPASSGSAVISLALAPTDTASTIPSFLATEGRDALEHGALHRLLRVPNRPWTQIELSAWHKTQFEILLGSMGIRAGKDGTRAPLRTTTCFDF